MHPTKKLGEICEIKTGKKDANYSTEDGIYPFFTCGKEILKAPGYSFDTDAILIAGNGDVGTCKKFNGKFEAYQRTYVLFDFQGINKDFLFYFLEGNLKKELLKETLGSAIPYIKLGSLQKRIIPLPPLPTQQKIVEKLDNILEKIEKNIAFTKQNLANIEEQNKSILEKIFRECEEEFEMIELEKICKKITDGSHNPPKGIEKGYPMISSRNLHNNEIIFENIRYLSEEDYVKENKRTNAQEGDILLSIVGTIGKVAIVRKKYGKFVMQRSLALLKLNIEKLFPEFVYYYFLSPNTQIHLIKGAKGATQKGIYLKDIKQIQIPLPPLSKQQEIVNYFDNIFDKNSKLKNLYEKNLQNLEELKQSILKEAFENEGFVK